MELVRGLNEKGQFKTLPDGVKLYTLFNNKVPQADFDVTDLRKLGAAMRDLQASNVSAMAGYTYLGQFLAHDLSRLRIEGHNKTVKSFTTDILRSDVSSVLDLSSVYDGAIAGSLMRKTGNAFMALGDAQVSDGPDLIGYDLPRNGLRACIGDDRNDENLIVSQLHVQFLKLHNFFVREISHDSPELGTELLFEAAREQVILHYQEVILHDFLYEILHPAVWKAIILENKHILWDPDPSEPAVLPVEYSAAAGRFGHAMVQNNYNLNAVTSVSVSELFEMTGEGRFGGKYQRMPATHLVDWRLFFDFPKHNTRGLPTRNKALRISPRVRVDLINTQSLPVPEESNLATRNLLRGLQMRLSSGQATVNHLLNNYQARLLELEIPICLLNRDQLNLNKPGFSRHVLDSCSPALSTHTPLWYYVLAEACVETFEGIGKLGPLGSLIVAESIRGLLQLDRDSIMYKTRRQDIAPSKNIANLPGRKFLQMSDLLLAANTSISDPTSLIIRQ